MIHPQYIIGLVDAGVCQFKIYKVKDKYVFIFNIYLKDIKILYQIKNRFKTGKIINLDNIYVLRISKQLDNIINFFERNRILTTKQRIISIRWIYLYKKLILQDSQLSIKEK